MPAIHALRSRLRTIARPVPLAAILAACGVLGGLPSSASGATAAPWLEPAMEGLPATAASLRRVEMPGAEGVPEWSERLDLAEGRLVLTFTDLVLPGGAGADLKVLRVYAAGGPRAAGPSDGAAAAGGWRVHFGRLYRSGTAGACTDTDPGSLDDNPVLETADGERIGLVASVSADATWRSENGWRIACRNGGLAVATSPRGVRIELGQAVADGAQRAWYATRVVPPAGLPIDVRYAAPGSAVPIGAAAADGRSVRLDYDDIGAQRRLRRIVASDGRAWSFDYAGGLLAGATRPDGLRWTFRYAEAVDASGVPLMVTAGLPHGGATRYAWSTQAARAGSAWREPFQSLRSRADDAGGRWTLAHESAGPVAVATTVWTTPAASTSFRWVAAADADAPAAWAPGLAAQRTIADTVSETYAWRSIRLGGERDPVASAAAGRAVATTMHRLATHVRRGDGATVTATHVHDAAGRPILSDLSDSVQGDASVTRRWNPDDPFASEAAPVEVRVDGGPVHRVDWDPQQRRVRMQRFGAETLIDLGTDGDVVRVQRPGRLAGTFSGYRAGMPRTATVGAVSMLREVDAAGRLVSASIDGRAVARLDYDAAGRLVGYVCADGSPVRLDWDARGVGIVSRSGTARVEFDGRGRIVSVSGPRRSATIERDAAGRVVSVTRDDAPGPWVYEFDALDRPVAIVFPDGGRTDRSLDAELFVARGRTLDPAHQAWVGLQAPDRLLPPPVIEALLDAGFRVDPSQAIRESAARALLGAPPPLLWARPVPAGAP